MTPEQFKQLLAEQGVQLTTVQMQQYASYYRMLVDWNSRMNLTAITDESSVYLKHFYDSVTLGLKTSLVTKPIHLCDVGAGAGFPSIPLKIAFPHIRVSIVDSLQKRLSFLNAVIEQLELENVMCYHNRAEVFGQDPTYREQFDVVTARAVARMNLLSEFCLPLVKVGGHFAAMKASSSVEELEEAIPAISLLGGSVVEDLAFELPFDSGLRHIVVVKKQEKTPKKYPRKPGVPAKNPLK